MENVDKVAYFIDDESFPVNSCHINISSDDITVASNNFSENHQCIQIQISKTLTILSTIQEDKSVNSNGIILHNWIKLFAQLESEHCIPVLISFIPISKISFSTEMLIIQLNYVGYATSDWFNEAIDLSIPLSELINPIKSKWPKGLTTHRVEYFAPMMLNDVYIGLGYFLAIKMLNLVLIFKVAGIASPSNDFNDSIDKFIKSNLNFQYQISLSQLNTTKTQLFLNEPSTVSHDETFSRQSIQRIWNITNQIFRRSDQDPNQFLLTTKSIGYHTILLIGPKGSGKTAAMNALKGQCIDEGILVGMASCIDIHQEDDPSSDYDTLQHDIHTMASQSDYDNLLLTLQRIQSLLHITLPTKSVEKIVIDQSFISNVQPFQLLLIIEDIDQVYFTSNPSKDESKTRRSVIASYLNRLIQLLSASHSDYPSPIVFIATTRWSIKSLYEPDSDYTHDEAVLISFPSFDCQVLIPRPSHSQRYQLLRVLMSNLSWDDANLPLEGINDSISQLPEKRLDDWAVKLAALTPGFLPGDLQNLIEKIQMTHERWLQNLTDREDHSMKSNVLLWDTALDAVAHAVPEQLKDIGVESTFSSRDQNNQKSLGWDDFVGYEDVKLQLQRLFSTQTVSTSSIDDQHGSSRLRDYINPPKGIVLYGPTGCGKTRLAKIIATEIQLNFINIRSTEILSPYFGQTEKQIRNIFQQARAAAPCLVFFDEFDAIAYARSGADSDESSSDVHNRILSTFLNELDGISAAITSSDGSSSQASNRNRHEDAVVVLVACADIHVLDEALIRPGRLQHHVFLHYPNSLDIYQLLQYYAAQRYPCDENIVWEDLVCDIMTARSDSKYEVNVADVEALCKLAVSVAIRTEILQIENFKEKNPEVDLNLDKTTGKVTIDHFLTALSQTEKNDIL